MYALTVVVCLLLLLTLCATALKRFAIPQPTLMIGLGVLIAFVPGLPRIELPPDLVLLVFLPPLLYSHAWYANWSDFKKNAPAISSLAVLLIVATAASVAATAHAVVPRMTWGVSFMLGAILAATDGIAASLIAHRMGLRRRLAALIEGEGLVNDAAAVVLFRIAVAAVVTGTFSGTDSWYSGILSAVGGVAIGFAAGWIATLAHRFTADAKLETVVTFLTPFVAYLPAEWAHLSGVTAVVTAGLYIGHRQSSLLTAETRLQAIAVWDVVSFVLNGLVFVLVGLQMRGIVEAAAGFGVWHLAGYAFAICATVLATRMLWLYIGAGMERLLNMDEPLSLGAATVIGWAGMRGAISLAVVLSLPKVMQDGTPLPFRDLLIFLTFSVILFTLILQGLTLPIVMRASGLCSSPRLGDAAQRARTAVTEAVVARLKSTRSLSKDAARMVANEYRQDARHRHLLSNLSPVEREKHLARDDALRHALQVERGVLLTMRDQGQIDDETMHDILRDGDLREVRLISRIGSMTNPPKVSTQ